MPKFRYTGKNETGLRVRGMEEASDEDALYQQLRNKGVFLTESNVARGEAAGRRLKTVQVADFCRQLGTLLSAGVSLVRALNIIANEEGLNPAVKRIYDRMLMDIRKGNALSDSMAAQGAAFPELLISMIRSSEGSGGIDKNAKRMADHYEKEHRLNQQVTSTMMYPGILAVLIVLVVVFILAYIVPQFDTIFAQMESLPLPTVILLGASEFVKQNWMLLAVVVALLIIAVGIIVRIPAVRLRIDRMKLHMPVVGKLQRKICTARFARTLSSLYSSGMPIILALQTGRSTVGNTYIASQFDAVLAMVRGGKNLSEAISTIDGFERKLSSSILVGEETGSLDDMLNTMSDAFDYEAEQAIKKMMTLLEPVMIVFMALIVGFILIAVITPIYQSYSTIGGSAGAL